MGTFKSNLIQSSTAKKTYPDREELERMDRVLRFFPSRVEQAEVLTREHLESFNRNGYLLGLELFSDAEVIQHRGYFDNLLAEVTKEGGDNYSIVSAHLKYGRIYDLLTDPRMVAYARDILGEDVVGWGSHYFCKMPGEAKTVAWHQDASYWPLTPAKTATFWLAIDDADTENACMQFISGSHQHGHLEFRDSTQEENNVLTQTVDDPQRYGETVDVVLAAGQMSVHTDLLLHSSRANLSNRRRCGLTLRYCAADVRGTHRWNEEGVLVSGADPSGHWANPTRPERD